MAPFGLICLNDCRSKTWQLQPEGQATRGRERQWMAVIRGSHVPCAAHPALLVLLVGSASGHQERGRERCAFFGIHVAVQGLLLAFCLVAGCSERTTACASRLHHHRSARPDTLYLVGAARGRLAGGDTSRQTLTWCLLSANLAEEGRNTP